MILFFAILQVILLLFMVFHDWIDLPPFTDRKNLRKFHSTQLLLFGSFLNGILVLIPLVLTLLYFEDTLPLWANGLFVIIYGIITLGTITAWWLPYLFGTNAPKMNRAELEVYQNTHHFLPKKKDRVVPNTLHVVLHIQVWSCFILSLYWLISGKW
jgi:hypothetical protein